MRRRALMTDLSGTLTALVLALSMAGAALAVQPNEVLKDTALEQRARELSAELRCLVCQNQSIDDSDAPLARDLRVLVRDRLKEGDSNQEVLDYIVARYGEFVLLKPPFAMHTLLLWLSPLLVLGGGILLARSVVSGRTAAASSDLRPEPALTEQEEQRLAEILSSGETGKD